MARPLDALLRPSSVAVVGASRSRATIGGEIFANLVSRPFGGPVFPVHSHASYVQGVRAYASIADVPDPVDLAVIAVPARDVPRVVSECAAAGVRACSIISAGFAEEGEGGRKAQEAMVLAARDAGMRIVGPNCLGVLSTELTVSLHATFATGWPPAGNVSIASQSGALGIALLDEARDHGIGVRDFVSLGNESDVCAEDLLEYWEEDAGTKVILLYLESFRDPRRFLEVARRVTRIKPVIAVKGGRSAAGVRAAGSHTGALATRDAVVDALLVQAGVLRVATLEELFDAAAVLSSEQVFTGKRMAILTNAGGPGILAADACESHGLTVPPLSDATRSALSGIAPGASLQNPVDLLASATPEGFDRAVPILLGDEGIDALLVTCVPTPTADVRRIARVVAGAGGYASKPVVAAVLGKRDVAEARAILGAGGIPVYALPEAAAAALASAVSYREARERPVGVPEPAMAPAVLRAGVRQPASAESRWLGPDEVTAVLETSGVRALPSVRARTGEEAGRVAAAMGFPVALKIVSRTVAHKSDVGGVLLGLNDVAAVEEGARTIQSRIAAAGLASALEGFLVQPMAPAGIEMFVGATRDPTFGPVVAAGAGGIELALWNDVVLRLAPVTAVEASTMVDGLRSRPRLDGYRGAAPGDRSALVQTIVRISQLVEAVPEIVEIDLNPLVTLPPGRGVVAVDARIRVVSTGGGRP